MRDPYRRVRPSRSWGVAIALLFVLTLPSGAETGYVGSATCRTCHAEISAAWSDSHHAWAWRAPDPAAVLGNFDDVEVESSNATARFSTRDGRFLVHSAGPDGAEREYPVHSTVGVAPLQQLLLATEPGRLQAFDLAWGVVRGRWFALYPDQSLSPGDGLHWSGPYKNWNSRCAECHATDYSKNYDPETQRYTSTQAEMGVGCEACHGPAADHVDLAKRERGPTSPWPRDDASGFAFRFDPRSAEAEVQQCAGCHSRREPLQDRSPQPGTAFADVYRLALLRPGLYHADGSIRDEVYVYGSFLQSKMYARGVRCTDCHDPHSARLKTETNAVCTQCHSQQGNPRFPTLRKAVYDSPSHHFHEVGDASARCTSCHMVERVYMQVDPRRDHSFRVPRPDLSDETGAPNACTDCHDDRSAAWAAEELRKRYPASAYRGAHYSQPFAVAREDPGAAKTALIEIAEDRGQPAIVRATALDLLAGVNDVAVADRSAALIRAEDALVREAAVALQRAAPPTDRVTRLLPAVRDGTRAVRIAAARTLFGSRTGPLSRSASEAIGRAMDEWSVALRGNADFPEAQMAIGGKALVMRDLPGAERAFREAVRLDPQATEAWIMIVRILESVGDPSGARAALDRAIAHNAEDAQLLAIRSRLRRP